VTWRIFLTDSSQPDLDVLTPADRAALTDELFAWVPNGPPQTRGQVVVGVQLYEDQLPSGISVTYFVDEQVPYFGVVRIRTRWPPLGYPAIAPSPRRSGAPVRRKWVTDDHRSSASGGRVQGSTRLRHPCR
jgi:hypothetical protein